MGISDGIEMSTIAHVHEATIVLAFQSSLATQRY